MANRRMSRVWKIQETDTVGSVMVGVPETGRHRQHRLPRRVERRDVRWHATRGCRSAAFTAGATNYLVDDRSISPTGSSSRSRPMIHAPGGVTGMALWVKANDGPSATTDGANVAVWADRSGASKDLSVLDDGQETCSRPTRRVALNFNPAVSLLNDATSDQGLWNEGFLGVRRHRQLQHRRLAVLRAHPAQDDRLQHAGAARAAGRRSPVDGPLREQRQPAVRHQRLPRRQHDVVVGRRADGAARRAGVSGYTWRYNVANSFFFRNNGAAVAERDRCRATAGATST